MPRKIEISKEAIEKAIIELKTDAYPHSYEVAEHLGASERALTRCLKKAGTTFLSLKNEIRYQHVMYDLTQTDKLIPIIAVEAGFKDQSTFGAQFRRRYDISPALLRRLAKKDRERLVENRKDLIAAIKRAKKMLGKSSLRPKCSSVIQKDAVIDAMRSLTKRGLPSSKLVAKRLRVSQKTLERHLAAQKTSYSDLKQELLSAQTWR